jgi:hypothetical protein
VKRCLALVPVAVLVACRFGGPSANPEAYVASDAGDDAAQQDAQGTPGDDATAAPGDADASVAPGDDTSPDDAAPPGEASVPDGPVEDGGCGATVAICDPVRNTGCNALQQCDVDMSQATTPTGICVFNSTSEGGGACVMSIVSESCAPKSTCVGGACRALCDCNSDCPAGQCCSDTSGPPGFTLCAACP